MCVSYFFADTYMCVYTTALSTGIFRQAVPRTELPDQSGVLGNLRPNNLIGQGPRSSNLSPINSCIDQRET